VEVRQHEEAQQARQGDVPGEVVKAIVERTTLEAETA